mmetsp:Transcript_810/g.1703  ORF Transcript_810/g.1703 Transcript_810/m.1703 type:complete len:344 (+) Transcript_810:1678-2709(+)
MTTVFFLSCSAWAFSIVSSSFIRFSIRMNLASHCVFSNRNSIDFPSDFFSSFSSSSFSAIKSRSLSSSFFTCMLIRMYSSSRCAQSSPNRTAFTRFMSYSTCSIFSCARCSSPKTCFFASTASSRNFFASTCSRFSSSSILPSFLNSCCLYPSVDFSFSRSSSLLFVCSVVSSCSRSFFTSSFCSFSSWVMSAPFVSTSRMRESSFSRWSLCSSACFNCFESEITCRFSFASPLPVAEDAVAAEARRLEDEATSALDGPAAPPAATLLLGYSRRTTRLTSSLNTMPFLSRLNSPCSFRTSSIGKLNCRASIDVSEWNRTRPVAIGSKSRSSFSSDSFCDSNVR